jgi:hypothetical protein
MKPFFLENGVVLKPLYAYSIDDKPVYFRNSETDEIELNTGQVI